MEIYKKAAMNVVKRIEKSPKEKILIIAEDSIPNEFPLEIFKLLNNNFSVTLMFFKDRKKANKEPPLFVVKVMKECDILIQCISNINLYTKAYLDAYQNKTKIFTMYGLDDYVIKNFIAFDNKKSKIKAEKIGNYLKNAKSVKIISSNGTDLSMKLVKRPVLIDDGYLKSNEWKGDLLPGYVISVAPLENSVNGILIADWSINPPLNLIRNPVRITFKNGKIISIEGKNESKKLISWLNSLKDERIFSVSHLSIGSNIAIKNLTGRYLLDERKYGTITIGLGNNLGPYKGENSSSNHCDLILRSATLLINGKKII